MSNNPLLSYAQRIERYKYLLKSNTCTPFWRTWIINKMCDLHIQYGG